MRIGLDPSLAHPENGMTRSDMIACEAVAKQLGETIIFRSTGPWAIRWIEAFHPTKNFHVKGKSSDWGPQAGLVPYDGIYSKVGSDTAKAKKGTAANDDGLHSKFAVRAKLFMSEAQIGVQLKQPAEGRTALQEVRSLPNGNLLLRAVRSGDGVSFTFYARKQVDGRFEVRVFEGNLASNIALILDRDPKGEKSKDFWVMASAETGAEEKAMTGDYDLLAICPRVSDRFSTSHAPISKPGIQVRGSDGSTTTFKDQSYGTGVGLDNVLDNRLHTGSSHLKSHAAYNKQHGVYKPNHKGEQDLQFDEHGDMGNVTPRILRCINALNTKMGAVGDKGYLRRVHHNAESHRYIDFGALKRKDLDGGEGFPFTVFHPPACAAQPRMTKYTTVCTLENMMEFLAYKADLEAAGYWLPTNFTWGMGNGNMKGRIADFDAKFKALPRR